MKNKTFFAMLTGAFIALVLTAFMLMLTAKTLNGSTVATTPHNAFIAHSSVATESASAVPEIIGQPRVIKIFEASSQLGIG